MRFIVNGLMNSKRAILLEGLRRDVTVSEVAERNGLNAPRVANATTNEQNKPCLFFFAATPHRAEN